ncbi:hypothetical protein D0T85_20755 [Bacteroides sp. 519]|nr:hypothetical protein [Bacteroides sp. 519]
MGLWGNLRCFFVETQCIASVGIVVWLCWTGGKMQCIVGIVGMALLGKRKDAMHCVSTIGILIWFGITKFQIGLNIANILGWSKSDFDFMLYYVCNI